jgi:hypothetical protein
MLYKKDIKLDYSNIVKKDTCVGANMAIFLGFTVCLEFTLNSLFWGLQAAFCKLKNVKDLQLGSARFPVPVTKFCSGVGVKLCNQLVSL